MITSNLYKKILIDPLKENLNKLFVVSGYASATFAHRHLNELRESKFKLNLIIGMQSNKNDHLAFINLLNEFPNNFSVFYYNKNPQVHCKLYAWLGGSNSLGFTGSANYSQSGFFEQQQRNQMVKDDPQEIKRFYDSLLPDSIPVNKYAYSEKSKLNLPKTIGDVPPGQVQWIEKNKTIRISFLDKKGILPEKSGLNWGHRKTKHKSKKTGIETYKSREPNEAYLSLKMGAREIGFLPETAFTFTLITDDNQSFNCVVAQQGRKAIHTTDDNSILGKYIRKRIGVAEGSFLKTEDLEKYGRTDFELTKLDNETFKLDFSV